IPGCRGGRGPCDSLMDLSTKEIAACFSPDFHKWSASGFHWSGLSVLVDWSDFGLCIAYM
ncbi:MAG: hypothetical protein ACF8AM_00360, partial [Rhodopirellula sp. JB055]|uniref:hypothetical protein n=1 Tax=Rhodopirellula sp. JB055 TaxID=3342846 RepID=UPI00370C0F46